MKSQDLQRYLEGVLDIECNIYVQSRTIQQLTSQYYSLANRKTLHEPQMGKPEASILACMFFTGIVCGIIVGLIALIHEWSTARGIIYYIASVIAAAFYAVGGFVVGGMVIGFFVWLVLYHHQKRQLQMQYIQEQEQYEADNARENRRIAQETVQKNALAKEVLDLQQCLKQSQKHLRQAYAFDIIAPDYRNIYAVSSMYGYLAKGRTHCLHFNELTGDPGAYNLFENEMRLDRIITNTEEIIQRIDQVQQYQQVLALGLQAASDRIDLLCASVNSQLNKVSASVAAVERCQSVIAYQTECATRELALLNWMHGIY